MQQNAYNPPRFWWLKRLVCAGVAYMVLLLAVRLWWGWEAERRFSAAIEKRRAAGEPVALENFRRPPIPDEKNAAHFLKQAGEAMKLPPGINSIGDIDMRGSIPQALALQVEELNQEALALIAAARDCPAANWNVHFTSPAINIVLPHLQMPRTLARLEMIAAVARLHTGNHAGALEAVEDTLLIGATLVDQMVIAHLVRIAIDALACDRLEQMIPLIRIADDADEQPSADRPATPDQITRLIDKLLDEEAYRRNWIGAFYFDRVLQTDTVNFALAGGFRGPNAAAPGLDFPPMQVFVLKPAWILDLSLMFEHTSRLAEAAGMMNWPAVVDWMRGGVGCPPFRNQYITINLPGVGAVAPTPEVSFLDRYIHVFSTKLMPPFEAAMRQSFRALALRRMSATALAIRLYEFDHACRPDCLADLVPEYLPAVPRDPFAADNRPLGYAPHAAPPVLYSVNVDGVDDGGCFELNQAGYVDRHLGDLLYFLDGDRPRIGPTVPAAASRPAATQPATNEPATGGTQGDNGRSDPGPE